MGGKTAGGAGRLLAGLVLALSIGSGVVAGEAEPWMPETLPGFLRALELGIAQNLSPHERDALSTRTHDQLRRTHPELHHKITRSFTRWTDAWVERTARELEQVPASHMRRAEQAVDEVDARLRAHFEARGWDYRSMRVVFLPRRLMNEPGLPSIEARGICLRYYPDLFFAMLDAGPGMRHTLIHESLHFNRHGLDLGRPLAEGIAETAASRLALDWGMVGRRTLREVNAYPGETALVAYLVDRMVERSERSREEALELLLHAYLTGDSTGVEATLGTAAWSAIVEASRGDGKVRKVARRSLDR